MIGLLIFLAVVLLFFTGCVLVILTRAVEVLNEAEISAAALNEICKNISPSTPGRVIVQGAVVNLGEQRMPRTFPKTGWGQ